MGVARGHTSLAQGISRSYTHYDIVLRSVCTKYSIHLTAQVVTITMATRECTVVSMERSWRQTSLWATSTISTCATWCRTSFRCCHHLHTATQHTNTTSPPLSSLLRPSPPFPSRFVQPVPLTPLHTSQ